MSRWAESQTAHDESGDSQSVAKQDFVTPVAWPHVQTMLCHQTTTCKSSRAPGCTQIVGVLYAPSVSDHSPTELFIICVESDYALSVSKFN